MFSANHCCNLGISVSGSKQILIRGFATMNPAAAAAAAEDAPTAEDVVGGGGGGGTGKSFSGNREGVSREPGSGSGSNDGGAKVKGLSRCWSSKDAAALVSPQIADSSSFGGEVTSRRYGNCARRREDIYGWGLHI